MSYAAYICLSGCDEVRGERLVFFPHREVEEWWQGGDGAVDV